MVRIMRLWDVMKLSGGEGWWAYYIEPLPATALVSQTIKIHIPGLCLRSLVLVSCGGMLRGMLLRHLHTTDRKESHIRETAWILTGSMRSSGG
jgi:hypothetical protein